MKLARFTTEHENLFSWEDLGYRVMEALRNHTQHRSLPTHGIHFPMMRDESVDPALLRFSVVSSLDITALEEDSEFKKTVLTELQAVSDKNKPLNIIPFIRTYTESFGRIHQCIREATATEVKKADNLIESYRTKYREEFASSLTGLAAISCDAQGLCNDHEYLNDRSITRRRELAKKNHNLDSISRRYVSSIALP